MLSIRNLLPINCLIYILGFFHLMVSGSSTLLTNSIILYTESNFTGSSATINVTECISPLNEVLNLNRSIASLDTKGQCVNLYQGENCAGEFIILKPSVPSHDKLNRWDNGSWKSERVQSIGPCDDECSSRNIYTPRPNTKMKVNFEISDVYLWSDTIQLEVEGCTVIPKDMRRKATSASVSDDGCIELYENWNCSGNSIRITKYIPSILTDDLSYWDFSEKAVAASPCGYNCYRPPSSDETTRFNSPGENIITILNEPGFKGDRKDLNLMDRECVKISEDWASAGIIESILTYNRCAMIFETDLNCNSSNEKPFQLNNSDSDILSHGWNNGIKSIAFCPKQMIIVKDAQTAKNIAINVNNDTKDKTVSSDLMDWKLLLSNYKTYLVLLLLIVIIVGIIICGIYISKLKKSNKRLAMRMSEEEIYEFRKGTTFIDSLVGSTENRYFLPHNQPYDQRYEISREYIHYDKNSILGEGEFGIVYRGRTNPPNFSKNCTVAVKTLKRFCDIEYVRAMLKEIKIMIYVGEHPNIVQLIGCHTENLANAELYIMTQLCENGSLLKFLQNYKHSFVNLLEDSSYFNLKPLDMGESNSKASKANLKTINGSHFSFIHLIQWSLQIAHGMEHLSNARVVHGDLAARNVLLDEHFTAKITDFGLSKQLYVDVNYMKKSKVPLPWRGMAIETLRSLQFSIESDIWSYGMTLWEIFTIGGLPYPGKVWDESFNDELANGLRPSKPKYATTELYALMMSCWEENPELRITFSELTKKVKESLATNLRNSSDPDFGNTKSLIALSSLPDSLRPQNSKRLESNSNDIPRRPPSAVPKFLSTFIPKQRSDSSKPPPPQRKKRQYLRLSKRPEEDEQTIF